MEIRKKKLVRIESQYWIDLNDYGSVVVVAVGTRSMYLHSDNRDSKGDLLQLASQVEAGSSRGIAVVISVAIA